MKKEFQVDGVTFEVNLIEIKDTKELQMKSLKAFADALGYNYCGFRAVFINYKHYTTGKRFINFRSMTDLHNKSNHDNHGREYDRWGFDIYTWNKAKAARICTVHLQLNCRTKYIGCQKHLVHFYNPLYEQLFLGDSV